MIDLKDKPDDFVSLYKSAVADPELSAKVPLISLDDGSVLVESMVILDYLEEVAPQGSLSAMQKARARLFAALYPGRLSSFSILKTDPGSDEEAAAVAKLRQDLRAMNAFLLDSDPSGPFLFGSSFTYAECAAAPFAQRLMTVLPGLRPDIDIQKWLAEDDLGRLAGWMDAVCARPSCTETIPPASELCDSFQKLVQMMKAREAPATR